MFVTDRFLQAFVLLFLILAVNCFYYPDLRTFQSSGYGGVFTFPQPFLEAEIDRDFPMRLDTPEVWMFLSTVKDITLEEELVVGVPYEFFEVSFILPVRVGSFDEPGDLQLAHFTAEGAALNPYLVDYQARKLVDFIDVYKGGDKDVITLFKGMDIMSIEVINNGFSKRSADDPILKRQADSFKIKVDYPNALDWGCDQIDRQASFCGILESFGFGVGSTDPNVCNVNENVEMNDDGQFYQIQIIEATGYFLQELPFLFSRPLPISSDFAFKGSVVESVGIRYPCP